MQQRTPYFYIIEHTTSGKRYAGCRYAKRCHPSELLVEGGYMTSSNTVKRIIEAEGLYAFKVVEIKEETEVGDVRAFETKYLIENDCASSPHWLNSHNNRIGFYGTIEYERIMIKNYGVENPFQSEYIKSKIMQKHQEAHGVDYYVQSKEFKEKSKQTNLRNCGYDCNLKCHKTKEKIINTNLQKYGFTSFAKTDKARSELSMRIIEKFENKMNARLSSGDYSSFEYLYDTIEHVFVSGAIHSLNRATPNRYVKISSAKNYARYRDELTGKIYSIDASMFTTPVTNFLTRIPYNRKGARYKKTKSIDR